MMNIYSSYEKYHYTREGSRGLKTTQRITYNQQVRYLPGIELRSTTHGQQDIKKRWIICLKNARISHKYGCFLVAENKKQIRFNGTDLTNSTTLEFDGHGELINCEQFYPFGGTAVWTARDKTGSRYKTIRYSGKEQDVTGLYYYGFRYYAPWLMRWLNTDPAGAADGLNVFRMVRNNPLTLGDSEGLSPDTLPEHIPSPELLDCCESLENLPAPLRNTIGNTVEISMGKRLDKFFLEKYWHEAAEILNGIPLPSPKNTFWSAVMKARRVINDAEYYEYGSSLNEFDVTHLPTYIALIPTTTAFSQPDGEVASLQFLTLNTIVSQLTQSEENMMALFESQKDLGFALMQNQISHFTQQALQDYPALFDGQTPKQESEPQPPVTSGSDIIKAHNALNLATYSTGAWDQVDARAEKNIHDFIQVEFLRHRLANYIASR